MTVNGIRQFYFHLDGTSLGVVKVTDRQIHRQPRSTSLTRDVI